MTAAAVLAHLDAEEGRHVGDTRRLLHVVRDDHDRVLVLQLVDEVLDALVEIGSRAEAGSSIRITSGSTAIARAMQRRCCWPPESPSALSLSRSSTSSQSAACASARSTRLVEVLLQPSTCGPKAMLS